MSALKPHPVTGAPLRWSRDMGLVGGTTSAFIPVLVRDVVPVGYPLAAALAGAVTGAALGLAMPALLDRVRGRVPFTLLVPGSIALGSIWGGGSGALAGAPFDATHVLLGLIAGSIAGGAQFGWWWFPYTVQTVRGASTWPLLVAAFAALPLVALASVAGTALLVQMGWEFAIGAGWVH